MASTLDEPSTEDPDRYGVRAEHVVASGDSGQLMQIVRLIDSGDVRPMVEMVMPLRKRAGRSR